MPEFVYLEYFPGLPHHRDGACEQAGVDGLADGRLVPGELHPGQPTDRYSRGFDAGQHAARVRAPQMNSEVWESAENRVLIYSVHVAARG
jgi:hypothetical protein